jgi:hypothetical protein
MLLVYGVFSNVSTTAAPPGLMTETWNLTTTGSYNVSSETATQTFAGTGATGTRAATFPSKVRGVAILMAIAPASP